MPTITIDNQQTMAPEGATVLEAARTLGIPIPTLCDLAGFAPRCSCLVCLVRVEGEARLVPACAYPVREGLKVESETAQVHEARRTALELLLSDHVGDCQAPCDRVCPLHLNVPLMLRHVAADDWAAAARVLRRAIPLAGVTGTLCHHPCETGCRRRQHDEAVSIREVERLVAEVAEEELATDPRPQPPSGKRVAVVGGGATGLTAAAFLQRAGAQCVVFDSGAEPGGALHKVVDAGELPRDILKSEVARLLASGVQWKGGTHVGETITVAQLAGEFDAVLLACGATAASQADVLGVDAGESGLRADKNTFETNVAGVFAAGGAVRGEARLVRVMADGRSAAEAVRQHLAGEPVTGWTNDFVSVIGRLSAQELGAFVSQEEVSPGGRASLASLQTRAAAGNESRRCLHCDCRKADNCDLRRHCESYSTNNRRFRAERKAFEQNAEHPLLLYEPGKCISCGRCVTLSEAAGEDLGLTFLGRGFPIRVSVPFGESLTAGLTKAAVDCATACPTGALCLRQGPGNLSPAE